MHVYLWIYYFIIRYVLDCCFLFLAAGVLGEEEYRRPQEAVRLLITTRVLKEITTKVLASAQSSSSSSSSAVEVASQCLSASFIEEVGYSLFLLILTLQSWINAVPSASAPTPTPASPLDLPPLPTLPSLASLASNVRTEITDNLAASMEGLVYLLDLIDHKGIMDWYAPSLIKHLSGNAHRHVCVCVCVWGFCSRLLV